VTVTRNRRGETASTTSPIDPADPLGAVRAELARSPLAPSPDRPLPPPLGGAVGYLGYDLVRYFDDIALPAAGGDGLPGFHFLLPRTMVVFDHTRSEIEIVTVPEGPGADDRDRARARIGQILELLAAPLPASARTRGPVGGADDSADPASGLEAEVPREEFMQRVSRAQEHILAGDAFEICLTQQMTAPLTSTPWDLYRALRGINPAPFAAFLRSGDVSVVGASPERFLSLDASGRLESRPIKGTRPRGSTPAEDARLRDELRDAEKDGAENLMIVDLVRSDLGRVARVGSVTVPELRTIESYATVHQMVSTVRAELRPGLDALDAVRACFPGGSMTGAPKLEAMAIIESLEPSPRGVYSGALGWLGYDGAMDLSIVIRTFVCAGGQAAFGVGGAVTADSEAGAEYRETLDKARALLAALRSAPACAAPDEGDRS